jgi:hypothetical protein
MAQAAAAGRGPRLPPAGVRPEKAQIIKPTCGCRDMPQATGRRPGINRTDRKPSQASLPSVTSQLIEADQPTKKKQKVRPCMAAVGHCSPNQIRANGHARLMLATSNGQPDFACDWALARMTERDACTRCVRMVPRGGQGLVPLSTRQLSARHSAKSPIWRVENHVVAGRHSRARTGAPDQQKAVFSAGLAL